MKFVWFIACLNMSLDMALRASERLLEYPFFANTDMDRVFMWFGAVLYVWAAFVIYFPRLGGER